MELWRQLASPEHLAIYAIHAASALLRQAQLMDDAGDQPVPGLWRVGQDVRRGDPGDKRARRYDRELGGRVLDVHVTAGVVVAVNERVGNDLPDRQQREVAKLDLLPARKVQRNRVTTHVDPVDHGFESGESGNVLAIVMAHFAARCLAVLVDDRRRGRPAEEDLASPQEGSVVRDDSERSQKIVGRKARQLAAGVGDRNKRSRARSTAPSDTSEATRLDG